MPNRPADHRTFNERVFPVVTALKKLGYPTIMPDHPDADDDQYQHWLDAATDALKAATAAGEEPQAAGVPVEEEHLRLQCVVGENIRRLADLIGYPYGNTDDVGQQLDFMVDDIIGMFQKIVARNEKLANQLEDCNTGMAKVRSMDKPHDPKNPAHEVVEEDDRVPATGRASSRPAAGEEREPLREAPIDPLAVRNTYPEHPPARNTKLGLTKQVGRRPMSGPWH